MIHLLETTMNNLKSKENCLIILKGFDKNIFKELSKTIEPAFFPEIFNEINPLEILKTKTRALYKQLLNMDEGIYLGRYEEILAIRDHIKLYENKIYIIENNLLKYYPYELEKNDLLFEYLSNKESEKLLESEPNIYENYFGDIIENNDKTYVIFKDLDNKEYNNIIKVPIFNEILENFIVKNEEYNKNLYYSYPPSKKEEFILEELKYNLLNNKKSISELNLILEPTFKKTNKALNELNIFNFLCEKNHISLNFYNKKIEYKKEYRKEFNEILKKHWNSNHFRELKFYEKPEVSKDKILISQGDIIEEIVCEIENAKRDFKSETKKKYENIFLTAPTGAGKSIFFQIPAIYIKEKYNYLTIVVSPLKALMKDQIEGLKERGIDYACFLNSDVSFIEKEKYIEEIKSGKISIVYLSPELLQLNSSIENLIGDREIGMIVIDEAHTVSTWGKNFRVDYLLIGNYVNKIKRNKQYEFPIVALTATAIYNGECDTVFDIIQSLNLESPKIHIGEVRKDNITFRINSFTPDQGSYDFNKSEMIKLRIKEKINNNKKSIFYFPYAKHVDENYLSLKGETLKYVARYTGKLSYQDKISFQDDFKNNNKKIMMATKAFGMGIDIPDIENIYHYALSGDLADYVQEIGRCARNKSSQGLAEIDFNKRDLKYARLLRSISGVKQWQMQLVIDKLIELYKLNKYKANMLISIESFSHIFLEKEQDLEKKLKQALLFLEKDLLEKYSYSVVIARPKVFFTSLFVVIDDNEVNNILTETNKKYFIKVQNKQNNSRLDRTIGYGKKQEIIHISDPGDIYSFDTSTYWEENFNDISYPDFIRKFFNGEIFNQNHITSRIKLKIELNEDFFKTVETLEKYLLSIQEVLKSIKGYFTKDTLELFLHENLKDKSKLFIKKICNIILTLYSFAPDPLNNKNSSDKFLRVRKNQEKNEETYILIAGNYSKFKSNIIRDFYEMFNEENTKFSRYLCKNSKYMRMASLLQTFELGVYEVNGGESSKIFIRINDPIKLQIISNSSNYKNSIISRIFQVGTKSDEILENFFSHKRSNEEYWDYIENFFLGRL
ncbi:DEAD/DEAH box helicase [Cetobacterium sp. SF1]|uniref:DEAD/DEAH box helicase n=1 Tax=Cetobacterium sp. SF1 TaxID=3417654 RepID=UPI003CF6497D